MCVCVRARAHECVCVRMCVFSTITDGAFVFVTSLCVAFPAWLYYYFINVIDTFPAINSNFEAEDPKLVPI